MANGRMISRDTAGDKKFNMLDDTSGKAFLLLVTFADCEGRTPGDPAMVRSMVFPRRQDISIEQMTEYIRRWNELGMVVWYEAEGDQWIWFPNFDKHQPGLRKDKESPSKIPPPPQEPTGIKPNNSVPTPDNGRSKDGGTPEQIPVKLKEEKGIEVNKGADAPFLPERQDQEPSKQERKPLDPSDINDPTWAILHGLTPPTPARGTPPDTSWLPADIEDLGKAFLLSSNLPAPIDKSTRSYWIAELRNMRLNDSLTVDDIRRGVKKMRNMGGLIKSPESIRTASLDIRAANGAENFSEVY